MKKRIAALVMAAAMSAGLLAGCGSSTETATSEAATETTEEAATEAATEAAEEVATEAVTEAATEAAEESGTETAELTPEDLAGLGVTVRVGSLKGPTTMGLVNLMADAENGETVGTYEFTMEADPSAIVSAFTAGDVDIAMIPSNLAATLYNKTEGNVSVIDINTLGVLYCVTGDESITSIEDLAGKTILSTGQGATPEYAIEYLCEQKGVTDYTLEFHSEATEIAALLKEDPSLIAILPQPFATAAQLQNDQLHEAFALTDVWSSVTSDSQLITGVTIVNNDFLAENPAAVVLFELEHAQSVQEINADPASGAELCVNYGIVEKAPLAQKAIPKCAISAIVDDEMETILSGYLQTLYDANPQSVGGVLPGEEFYYHVGNYTVE